MSCLGNQNVFSPVLAKFQFLSRSFHGSPLPGFTFGKSSASDANRNGSAPVKSGNKQLRVLRQLSPLALAFLIFGCPALLTAQSGPGLHANAEEMQGQIDSLKALVHQ